MYNHDTIAAISTPGGVGAIGIIRISGSKAHSIANKIFRGKNPFNDLKPNTITYGHIYDSKNNLQIDEVLISKFNKPKSFTCEDMVEINTHGGMAVQRKVLELLLHEGATLAEPGDFTKRAFLNGRIDLSQAEGIIDIINAKTELSARSALSQLEGSISKKINYLRESLILAIAKLEVLIDYPEYEVDEDVDEILKSLIPVSEKLAEDIKNFEKGKIIREGINVVIIGKPNVGKSSLLNVLSGTERAIVTDIPGTTRDTIYESININGLLLNIIDTAGIRDTEDIIEKIGVKKAIDEIKKADLIIAVLDAEDSDFIEEEAILSQIKNRKSIVVINKIDLAKEEKISKIKNHLKEKPCVLISVKEEKGIDTLTSVIYNMFLDGNIDISSAEIVTNIRHKNLMEKAREALDESFFAYNAKQPIDIFTIDIKRAAKYLGEITGENVNDEVIKTIFKNFCLGK